MIGIDFLVSTFLITSRANHSCPMRPLDFQHLASMTPDKPAVRFSERPKTRNYFRDTSVRKKAPAGVHPAGAN